MMTRKKTKVFLAMIAGGLFILLLAITLSESPVTKPRKIKCVGDDRTISSLVLPNLKGEKIDVVQFRGKVVLLNFWATWCAPCREEIPYLNELHKQYKENGLVVVGISLDRGGTEEVHTFLEKHPINYLILMGTDAVFEAFNEIPGMSGIQASPITFLIDRKGQICRRYVGFTEKRVLDEAVKQFF